MQLQGHTFQEVQLLECLVETFISNKVVRYNKIQWHNHKEKKKNVWKPYLLIKLEALDHRKSIAKESINIWQTRVIKWYSSISNRTHNAVAPPSTLPEIFLFLHRTTSAAARQDPIKKNMIKTIEKIIIEWMLQILLL